NRTTAAGAEWERAAARRSRSPDRPGISLDPTGDLRASARHPKALQSRLGRRPGHGRLRAIPEETMNRGDVVLVDWPFSDLTGSKLRPAIVVQADYLNGIADDTIYVKVTGRRFGIPGTEVEIDPAVETSSGLLKLSYASCKDLLTRDQTLVQHMLGVLSDSTMRQIDDCLKKVLELP